MLNIFRYNHEEAFVGLASLEKALRPQTEM